MLSLLPSLWEGDTNVLSLFLLFQLGYVLDDEQLSTIFWRFKSVAEQKKVIGPGYFIIFIQMFSLCFQGPADRFMFAC